MLFQPIASLLDCHRLELSRGQAGGDRRIVNSNNRGQVPFPRIANFHSTIRRDLLRATKRAGMSRPPVFSHCHCAHAAGKNAFSKVDWKAPTALSPMLNLGLTVALLAQNSSM